MRKRFIAILLLVVLVALAGCGGGGTTTTGTALATQTPVASVSVGKASDYTGSWSGSYAVGAGSKTFATMSLTGVDGTKAVTGSFYSTLLSGVFTGTIGTDGNVTGTVLNKIDNNEWSVVFGKAASTLNIVSITHGASALGSGSCTNTPSITADLTGAWKGTLIEVGNGINGVDGKPLSGAVVQVIDLNLAYNGSGFEGVIISDKGLISTFLFELLSGNWYSVLRHGVSWGSVIPTPYNDILYTESLVSTDASMTQSFIENAATPTVLQDIIFTMHYSVINSGVTTPDGGYGKYRLSLSRV